MSTNQERRAQEWRQFRLLSRGSVRRLLNTALFSPDADPDQFAIWGITLLSLPPLLYAVRRTVVFSLLRFAPDSVVERVVLTDRLFFVVYGMIAAALLAALTWEALFPSRVDQEVIGTLPVRPRTLAAARLGAAAALAGILTAAVSVPGALLYSVGSSTHPLVGSPPRVLAAHLVATTLACAWMFFTLLSVRGLVAICAGERVAERLATIAQIATIVGLFEALLFLPSALETLVTRLGDGATYPWLPPVWFGSLFSVMAESKPPHAFEPALIGVIATLVSVGLAIAVSLLPARIMGRRALEARTIDTDQGMVTIARVFAAAIIRQARVRALFLFAVASLASSRRHRLILAMYFGVAIAAATVSLAIGDMLGNLSTATPLPWLLAIPLVFIFLVVFGLRACLLVPTAIEANWPFRLAPPTVAATTTAARLVIVFAGLLPIIVLTTITAAGLWSARIALHIAVFDAVAGLCLIDGALLTWASIPFASAHQPSTDTVKSRWLIHAFALWLFALPLANLQETILRTQAGTMAYVIVGAAVLAVLRFSIWYSARRRTLAVDLPWQGPELLNLSQALD